MELKVDYEQSRGDFEFWYPLGSSRVRSLKMKPTDALQIQFFCFTQKLRGIQKYVYSKISLFHYGHGHT